MNRRLLFIAIVGLAAVVAFFTTITLTRRTPPAQPVAVSPVTPPTSPTPPPVAVATETAPEAAAPPAPAPAAPAAPRAAVRKPAVVPPPAAAPAAVVDPQLGTLRIDSDVRGAQVFIDREFIGVTPVTAPNVKPGTHRLNVSVEGYEGVAETLDVSPGDRDVHIKFKEVRLDAKVDVVHKHRLGSCKGRLVATSRGMRYETDDKDDAFSAGLLDLETFEVDYLAKTLRVKSRNGKRYDFMDPDGNADRLFVFHRDTQKAVTRLKNGDPPG